MNYLTRKIFNIKCKNPIIKQTQKVLFCTKQPNKISTIYRHLTIPTYLMIGFGSCAYYCASLILTGHNISDDYIDEIIWSVPLWFLYIPIMTVTNCCFIYEKYIK